MEIRSKRDSSVRVVMLLDCLGDLEMAVGQMWWSLGFAGISEESLPECGCGSDGGKSCCVLRSNVVGATVGQYWYD